MPGAQDGDGLAPLPTDLDFQAISPPVHEMEEMGDVIEALPWENRQTRPEGSIPAAESKDQPSDQAVPEPADTVDQAEIHPGVDDAAIAADNTDVVEPMDSAMDIDVRPEDHEGEEEAAEEVEERPEVNADLFGILQSLRYDEEEAAEEVDEVQDEPEPEQEMETALSSPLSDLPDLPSEFPPSPPRLRSLTPPTAPNVRRGSRSQPPAGLPAETSAAGAKRAASPILTIESAMKKFKKTPQNSATRVLSPKGKEKEEEEDDLCSITGDAEDPPRHTLNGIGTSNEASSHKEEGPKSNGRPLKMERGLSEEKKVAKKPRKKAAPAEEGEMIPGQATKKKRKLDPISFQPRTVDIPEKFIPRSHVLNATQMKAFLKGKTKEVQMAPCLRPRYEPWGKCTQCVSKIGGDSCRFRDYRTFPIDPETTEILGPGVFESTEWKDEMTVLPKDFNVDFTEEHMRRIEQTVAPLLLPLITREVRHVVRNDAIKRGTDAAKHRAVCDFCSSTIFGGWFFCKVCGRDYCLACERYFADEAETMEESPWHLPPAARPRLLRCTASTNARTKKQFHFRPDLQPVSRFSKDELKKHWLSLAEFVLHSEGNVGDRLKLFGLPNADDETISQMQDWLVKLSVPPDRPPTPLSDPEIRALYTKTTNTTAEPIPDPAQLEDRSHPFTFIDAGKLSLEVFDQLWARGEPIVVDKVGDKFKMSWTPEDFIQRFGKEPCVIVDCQTNAPKYSTVESFFNLFQGGATRPQAVMKLKDWPQTEDFASTHPDLYNDFCDALPVPNYTRREGVLNLYSHFPPGPTRPDIGPKMYNAFAAKQTSGGQGSTRLHMDVADAVNVMLYASPQPNGQPGCAVWDLFRAEDADKIRAYLKHKFDKTHPFTDPIHSQHFYLDSNRRKELAEKYGVVSFRVYQYPGQAVFIPAGCAHQVCNLADSIKIALDFVSPHNVNRCKQLTQDFRTENFFKVWKEDVLQLYNVLWYAWTNVAETRERRKIEAKQREEEARLRAARVEQLQNGEHEPDSASGPFTPGFGDRHRLSGLLGSAVSSVRDEENPRSPSLAQSRGSTPTRMDGTSAARNEATPSRSIAQIEEGDTAHEDTVDKTEPAEKEKEPPEKRSKTAIFAEKLLIATLLANEPPPPPEARAPSAATRYATTTRGAAASRSKTKSGAVSRSRSVTATPAREEGNGTVETRTDAGPVNDTGRSLVEKDTNDAAAESQASAVGETKKSDLVLGEQTEKGKDVPQTAADSETALGQPASTELKDAQKIHVDGDNAASEATRQPLQGRMNGESTQPIDIARDQITEAHQAKNNASIKAAPAPPPAPIAGLAANGSGIDADPTSHPVPNNPDRDVGRQTVGEEAMLKETQAEPFAEEHSSLGNPSAQTVAPGSLAPGSLVDAVPHVSPPEIAASTPSAIQGEDDNNVKGPDGNQPASDLSQVEL